MLVQKAASETKRVALVPPACPGPTALFGESGSRQAAAPQTHDDIARPEAGEKGVCLPVRADPDTSDSRQVSKASKGLWEGVLQLQDMRNVNQNCILAPALCFEPPLTSAG